MSASILRAAAAKAREVAEAATPGPWCVPNADDEYVGPADVVGPGVPGERYIVCEHAGSDAAHIALWHPGVALAVADWLDSRADLDAVLRENGARGFTDDSHECMIARLLLGGSDV